MWNRIHALIIKEFLAVWRDKKSRVVLVLPPILQMFIFSMAVTLDVKNIHMAVYNMDNGKSSFELIERFRGSPFFTNIKTLHSEQEIAEAIDRQEALLAVHFDASFSRKVESEMTAPMQVILDGRKSNSAQIAQGYITNIINQYNTELNVGSDFRHAPSQLVPRNWFNPNLLYPWFTVPNLVGILSMLVSLLVTSLSVARERELGTFDQLLVSPLLPFEILIGKTLPGVIIGMLEGLFIALAAIWIFGVPFYGSWFLLILSLLIFIFSVVGVGLFISSLSQTQQQAILGVFVFMPPAVMLSGYATPIENMPEWLQTATLANPLRHFLVLVKGIYLKAMPFDIAFQFIWPMAVIAVITLTGAAWFFRRKIE